MTTRPQGISATELMAQLQRDPEYQRKTQAVEEERQGRARDLARAERPIVADLRDAGVRVESVWDLVNTAEPYPAALPVLLRHLELGGYPERVMESLGRALAVKPAIVYWDRLKTLYLAPRDVGEEEGAAVALAASATGAQLDELIELLSHQERGQTRIYFLRPVLFLGGSRGLEVVRSLRADPVFANEVAAVLSREE